ncbi:hypothetical protein BST61_g5841 [Cercospora zeina]
MVLPREAGLFTRQDDVDGAVFFRAPPTAIAPKAVLLQCDELMSETKAGREVERDEVGRQGASLHIALAEAFVPCSGKSLPFEDALLRQERVSTRHEQAGRPTNSCAGLTNERVPLNTAHDCVCNVDRQAAGTETAGCSRRICRDLPATQAGWPKLAAPIDTWSSRLRRPKESRGSSVTLKKEQPSNACPISDNSQVPRASACLLQAACPPSPA